VQPQRSSVGILIPNGVGRPVVVATTPEIKPIIKRLLGDRQNRGEINEQTTSHSKKTDT